MNNSKYPQPYNFQASPGAAGNIDAPGLAHQIAAKLNTDATHGQIIRAIKKYDDLISPVTYTLSNDFSATSAIASINQTFDASYAFFGYAWSAVAESTDIDFLVTGLQITQQTNIIINNYPVKALTNLTAQYPPLFWYVPANSTVTLTLQNGSTTANNLCYFSFYGTRVPIGLINSLIKK